jgi:hypothetical protein
MNVAMRAWLRRLARSQHRDALVLRGSVVTNLWCPERGTAEDLDLVQIPPFSRECDVARLLAVASIDADDGCRFDAHTAVATVIWEEHPLPGVRLVVSLGETALQIDAAHGDPIDPAPIDVQIDGVEGTLRAVRPETMLAWKVHGLVEFGRGRWRPKDLVDAWLIARRVSLDPCALTRALQLAFTSRATLPLAASSLLYDDTWGTSRASRRRWDRWHGVAPRACTRDAMICVRNELRTTLRPHFEALGITAPEE